MEVLARDAERRRKATRAALAVTALLGAGCLVMEQLGVEPAEEMGFSHRLHVEDEGMECFMCHVSWEDDDDPGMPTAAACALCHESIDEDKPPERRIDALFDGEVFRAVKASDVGDEVVFSHLFHAYDEDSCVNCHAAVIESDKVQPWMGVTMDDCMACHAEVGASNDCATCHSQLDVDVAPWTHGAVWQTHHGLAVRNGSTETVDSCQLCHTQSYCVECHIENPPQNHTNFFRRRGHTIEASLDRQTCAACHTPDFCSRCHESTLPVSHRGQWGSPRNTHCYSCHLSSPDQGCFLCHQEVVSHDTAPPLPPGHSPMSDCRECHQLLTHVDGGTSCLVCHQ